jgi:hypothetical protein
MAETAALMHGRHAVTAGLFDGSNEFITVSMPEIAIL